MDIDHTATLICRGIGLLLLILGFSAILPAIIYGPRSSPFYAPVGRGGITWLQTVTLFLRATLPAFTQLLAGVLLLVFSRPLGHLLASGLVGPAA